MKKVVLDTSALLAVILNEPEKKRIVELTDGLGLMAPKSLHWEIGNAFSGMFKMKRLTSKEAVKGVKIYQKIPIEFVDVDLEESIYLCDRFNIYAYDAYMLVCSQMAKAPLLTLDQQLLKVARKGKYNLLEV